MSRSMTITPAEWASMQDGHLWLVREGTWPKACPLTDPTDCNGEHCDCPLAPPVEFVQACAPCEPSAPWFERQHPGCNYLPGHFSGGALYCNKCGMMNHCPDCRIELVGSCLLCGGSGRTLGGPLGEDVGDCRCAMTEGLIVFGHAYAVGQPTPILARTSTSACSIIGPHVCVNSSGAVVPIDNGAMPNIADALAHYGPPESLVGKWALQVQVTP